MHPRIVRSLPLSLAVALAGTAAFAENESLKLRLSVGHRSPTAEAYSVRFLPGSSGVSVGAPAGVGLEDGDVAGDLTKLSAGAGDVDGLDLSVEWPRPTAPERKPHSIWQYLLDHGSEGQVARLRDDPGLRPDAPILGVRLSEDGTRGFSVGLEQLRRHRAMWVPEWDVFLTLADAPVDWHRHVASLQGRRVLDAARTGPEATLAQFRSLWEDVGDPVAYRVPWETSWLGTRGHLVVTAAAHGSLYKFAVDREGRVRPDFASPHQFRFDPLWTNVTWKSQRIIDGLPIVATRFEGEGRTYELEQFATRRDGEAAPLRRGEIASVFVTRVRVSGAAGPVRLDFRFVSEPTNSMLRAYASEGGHAVVEERSGRIWSAIQPGSGWTIETMAADLTAAPGHRREVVVRCATDLAAGATQELVVKLASPPVPSDGWARLAALDPSTARSSTVRYWEDWLAEGARFEVPEPPVNDLFRANLWHALVLPRHRLDDRGKPRIDLPYANTAYGQLNADWPINQAVYVDYMIYGLRGYGAVAEEEFHAMFQSQQQPDGRMAGYANWGVYSPAQLYAMAQNYLLSGDRASFDRLLPNSLRTLDWCLGQVARARSAPDARGLIRAPLNDLTHAEREWAFPQAYFVAGLDTFARALQAHGHARAAEVRQVAERMRVDVERAFARASVASPVVPLADGTWQNYVPCDALTPRRLLEEWYPTDVDCGPVHLARLAAVDPKGWLATSMIHDHEDNLFFGNRGAANEPVYNQQATVYLRRDEPEAAIRAFYSMTACAFSHGQLSPLEHRWAWGQYFGPPSTDGAWFELYRNLIVREREDDSLIIGQATPRAWLADGRRIRVERAPTYFGEVNLLLESRASAGAIAATVEWTPRRRPTALLVRLRHPDRAPLRRVAVNGQPWNDFARDLEWVRIPDPRENRYRIEARY